MQKTISISPKNRRKERGILCILALALTLFALLATGCSGCNGDPTPPVPTDRPEAGVYYYDAGYDEYTLTLNRDGSFALIYKGKSESGAYTLDGEALTLDFTAEGKENASASLADAVITLNYAGGSMRFLKKVEYTVSFDTGNGSSLSDVTVMNGKTVAKPTDPTLAGHLFIGWYKDADFRTPYTFGTPVTQNTTVYARFAPVSADAFDYTVKLDPNYEGAPAVEALRTVGGVLYGLPTLTREGYSFGGWWISMENDGARLSYRYEEGKTLGGNATLYALWQPDRVGTQLPAPAVSISVGAITWNDVGARSYTVTVKDGSGKTVYEEALGGTSLNFAFADLAAGLYEITVTAVAGTGEEDNSEATRYYINRALDKVSVFTVVEPSVLTFNTVAGAEKYLITVLCGTAGHNHTLFDNGTSRSFNFANCAMTSEGIRFTVTAVARGYASSTSEVFVYKRNLATVTGMTYDPATETVTWNDVAGATHYMVSVTCGNSAHSHDFKNCGASTSLSLKECLAKEGGITVRVYPAARGCYSPAATELVCKKTASPTPSGIRVSGNRLLWNVQIGIEEYEVEVNGTVYKTETASFDLSTAVSGSEGELCTVRVRALGDTPSAWSDPLTVSYLEMQDSLIYAGGILTWTPVVGATAYEVQVNDGEIQTLPTDRNFHCCHITLTQAGANRLRVRYTDGTNTSDWVEISVFAHTLTLDARGGNGPTVLYLAVGDPVLLPVPQKEGYTFTAWYNLPGGAQAGGALYADTYYAEAGDLVLYAAYEAVKVNISYNYGTGGTGDRTEEAVGYEQHYTLLVPTPSSPTSAFGGWFSAPNGMGTQYTDAKGNSLAPWDALAGGEVFAFWIDYTLRFNLTKVNGKDAYSVTAGERIALLTEVTVPATYNGLPVAMLAGNAFLGCTNLTVINLPDTLEVISNVDPFAGCTALTAVNVYRAEGNHSVRYFTEDGVLFDNGQDPASPKPSLLFMPSAKTGAYRIPSGIVEIPQGAFAGSLLSKITVPAGVTRIGKEAFADCLFLSSVIFETASEEKPLTVEARAFAGCVSLEKITLPARLGAIELTKYSAVGTVVFVEEADCAFVGCTSLSSVNVAKGNKTYRAVDGVLYSADGKTLLYAPATLSGAFSLPVGTQAIAPGAFVGCTALTEVYIPSTVTAIGEYAFYGLSEKFTKVTFGGNGFSDVTVGAYAFRDCAALSDTVFETGSRVAVLSEGAFYGCSALTEFRIPASLTEVGVCAFGNCTGLVSLSFAPNGKTLAFGENAFSGCASLTSVALPANVSEMPGIFSGCLNLAEVTVDPQNPYFTADGGVLFNKDKTEIVFFPHGKTGPYRVPDGVKVIGAAVFENNTGVTVLTLPNTLEKIGDNAFAYSKITEIRFEGETYGASLVIGKSAFENTSALTSLVLPRHTVSLGDNAFSASSVSSLTLNAGLQSIGAYCFAYTYYLSSYDIPGSVESIGDYCFSFSWAQSVKFNEGLAVIGKHVFENTYYITSVEIPASVRVIDDYAFSGAWLTSVTFAPNAKLERIGAHAFRGTQITSLSLPASLVEIGAYAFSNCTSLSSVTFAEGGTGDLVLGTAHRYTYKDPYTGNNVTEIQTGHVFDGATKLTSVTFPSRLTELKEYCFHTAGTAAGGLTVSFGENSRLTTVGAYCFYKSALTSVKIPASVKNLAPVISDENGLTYDRMGIGAYAFAECKKLVSVEFVLGGSEPLSLGAYAFSGAGQITSVTLPARLAPYTSYTGDELLGFANGADVFAGVSSLAAVMIEKGGMHYGDRDGVVFTADFRELIFCPVAKSGAVTLPGTLTKIWDKAFCGCSSLTAIHFAEGSEKLYIGDSVFVGCSRIEELVLPDRVASLGASAFKDCTSLKRLTLSGNIGVLDGGMIENCPSLESITVSGGDADFYYDKGAIYNKDKTVLLLYPASLVSSSYTLLATTVAIAPEAFVGNPYLTSLTLPASLEEIGEYAFKNCTALKNITFPKRLAVIGKGAFVGCTSLAEPTFEAGGTAVLAIADEAFALCGIRRITLPARLSVLGSDVFANSGLEEVSFASGSRLTEMGDRVFFGTKLGAVTLPEGLEKIGASLFEGSTVSSVKFPASLLTMGVCSFKDCKSLAEVTFAAGAKLEVLPAGTFYASSLPTFTVPAGVLLIEDKEEGNYYSYGVFEACYALESILFENGSRLEEIGERAFYGCASLSEIVIPASVSTLGYLGFYGCTSLESITLPVTVTRIGHSLFYGCTSLKTVILNTMTTELPDKLFYNCSALTSLTLPVNLTSIGTDCFKGSGIANFAVAKGNTAYAAVDGILYSADLREILFFPPKKQATELTIPKEVVTVGPGTFSNLTSLKKVVFEEGGTAPLTIGDYAFAYCYSLHTLVLPERLTSIGTYAFQNCTSLMRVELPTNLESIGDYAFYYCNKLVEVYNKSDLNVVAKETGNGYVGYYAYNVYSPKAGAGIVYTDENGYVTATLTKYDVNAYDYVTRKFLLGYVGEETKLTLPANFDAFFDYAFYRAEGLESIYVPATAGTAGMGNYVFASCGKPMLFFGVAEKPSAWSASWNTDACTVVWGSDGKSHTYTFDTGCDQTVDPITSATAITLPTLDGRDGWVFVGWFDNALGSGDALKSPYYSTEKTALYAIWREANEEPPAPTPGDDRENAIPLSPNTATDVKVDAEGKKIYFTFTATQDGTYTLTLTGAYGRIELYKGTATLPSATATETLGTPATLTCSLTANTVCYVVVSAQLGTGDYSLTLTPPAVTPPEGGEGGEGGEGEEEEETEFERTPEFENATAIESGKEITVSVTEGGMKKYYKYTVTEAGEFTLTLLGDYSHLSLYRENGDVLLRIEDANDTWGKTERTYTFAVGEVYYIVVSGTYEYIVKDFTLKLTAPSDEEQGGETGDKVAVTGGTSFETAVDLATGVTYSFKVDSTTKKIYFKFTVPANGKYRVYVNNGDAMVQIYNADMTTTHQSNIYGNWMSGELSSDTAELIAGETYYIAVSMTWGNAELEFIFTEA